MTAIDPARASRLGRRSRTKGASFERMIANELREVFGPQVRRGLGQARSAGEVSDVDGTPWWVECKHGKRPNIPRAIAQAIEASAGRRPPLVISRANAEPILVTMLFADWKILVKQSQQKECEKNGKQSTETASERTTETTKDSSEKNP